MSYSRQDLAKMTYEEFDQYMRSNRGSLHLTQAEQYEKDALSLLHYLQDVPNLTPSHQCLSQSIRCIY